MDILDFVPFLEFIRNDEETISIIAEASVVIPKVCDILGISLSDSEAEDDARNENERPGPGQTRVETGSDIPGSQDNQRPRQALPSASMTLQNIFNSHAKDNNPCPSVATVGASSSGFRKRGSSTGVSPRTEVVTGATPSSSVGQASQNIVLPPKKRRVQNSAGPDSAATRAICTSQNSASTESPSPTATTATTIGDDSIKEKLRQDIDSFNEKIRMLAGLERQKNQLLESLLKISTEITQQRSPSESDNVEETEGEAESSAESDLSDDDDDDVDGSDFDSDELDDDEEDEFEETETTEVVEEQIVSLDMMDVIHHDEPNNY